MRTQWTKTTSFSIGFFQPNEFLFFDVVQKLWMNFSTVKMLWANKNFKLFTAEKIRIKSTHKKKNFREHFNFNCLLVFFYFFSTCDEVYQMFTRSIKYICPGIGMRKYIVNVIFWPLLPFLVPRQNKALSKEVKDC